jgi:hypothetical protein
VIFFVFHQFFSKKLFFFCFFLGFFGVKYFSCEKEKKLTH